ncbi:MAG: DUF72 domain-containing protein [Synergistales bacterium]|nr:DUF72 domain-containing protein [Synergistales bacterium]
MGELRIGTCSWAESSLIDSGFYPGSENRPAKRLRYYARFFDTVEVDSTFYAMPAQETVYRWAARTPPRFLFNVKAFGLFTFHPVVVTRLPPWARGAAPQKKERVTLWDLPLGVRRQLWAYFKRSVGHLAGMGRMGYLLFQLPPWFKFSRKNLEYFTRISEVAAPMKVAVEVRHRSWFDEENRQPFLKTLERENIAYVGVDEPELAWTVPPEWPRTASWGSVLRFHGRNRRAWRKKGATVQERFAYRYDSAELEGWKDRIAGQVWKEGRVFVMFNNCYRDWAVESARKMQALFGFAPERGPRQMTLTEGIGLNDGGIP